MPNNYDLFHVNGSFIAEEGTFKGFFWVLRIFSRLINEFLRAFVGFLRFF
jgi:hypothetical protein